MACRRIEIPMPDGTVATGIVCGVRERKRVCVGCGARVNESAGRLCDWKLTGPKEGKTCDRFACTRCAKSAPDKDLCPTHAALWARHPKNPANRAA